MPDAIFTALLTHSGWGIGLAVAIWAWWTERKENRLLVQALIAAQKDQATSQQSLATATEQISDRLDNFMQSYIVRRGGPR